MKETRKIIRIDEELCDGCGLCVPSCAEGAIQIVDGKAKLVSEVYCDGLGACLGDCPNDALTIEERKAEAFDEEAVEKFLAGQKKSEPEPAPAQKPHGFSGCPGSALRSFAPRPSNSPEPEAQAGSLLPSQLSHWPVQLKLVGPNAPFLKNADLLICADCVPFTVPDFHSRYLQGKTVLVGCPKLDDLEYYRDKLKAIFSEARPASVTVLRMEVPCCGGIVHASLDARDTALPELPVEVHTIGIRGSIEIETVSGRSQAIAGGE